MKLVRIHPIREPADTDTDEQDHTVPDGVESKITAMMEIINRNYDTLPADQSYIHVFIQCDDESCKYQESQKQRGLEMPSHPCPRREGQKRQLCVKI